MEESEFINKHFDVKVNVEYCGVCDYGGKCLELGSLIKKATPGVEMTCKRGRQGSFEIKINDILVYSKLRTMALPDYNEVIDVVENAVNNGTINIIKKEQPVDCSIS